MVAVSKDVDYAFAGNPITLEGSSLTGDRARFKLTAKPFDSTLKLYDENDENYLESRGDTRCVIIPDKPGIYTIKAIDETVTVNVKHFSNDGGTGQSKGIATATVNASASYSLYVGEVLQRELGIGEHKCKLTVHAHSNGSTSGVLTYRAGAGYAATLTGSTTPIMDMAIRATAVTDVLTYFGMTSSYAGTSTVIGYSSFAAQPAVTLRNIADSFDRHKFQTTSAVHGATDSANLIVTAKPTSEATLVTYVNELRTKVGNHFATGASVHPYTLHGRTLSVGAATNKGSCVLLLANIKYHFDLHRFTCNNLTNEEHYQYGDGTPGSAFPWDTPATSHSTSVIISYATGCVAAFNHHINETTTNATYHVSTTAHLAMPLVSTNASWEEIQHTANTCIDAYELHGANLTEARATAAAHSSGPDYSATVPIRASDRASTIETIDYLGWAVTQHTQNGTGEWHNDGLNTGYAQQPQYLTGATSRLQYAILDRLKGASSSTPPNTLDCVNYLVNKTSFTKA